MGGLDPETLAGGSRSESEQPKKQRMVNVVNTHRFRSFHLRHGHKIPPGGQGKIPLPLFNKVKDQCAWLKRAERGDVI